jgi:glycosyltransferase involved in cell wall biosynthesis
MINEKPRVSIGLPVFNGEEYLAETLDSILAQTYSDFELIISDNASTDGTQEICRAYAARDRRIRYFRNETNLGAAKNYNRVFELSSGEYFKWAAHDDLYAPEYLERCVEVLDREPSVVICHPETIMIDEHSEYVEDFDDYLDLRSPRPHERLRDYLFRPVGRCNAIIGVIRASELKQTPLIESYVGSDAVLLGELSLHGQVYRVPEHLFFRRDHPQASQRANPTRSARAAWFDPANRGKIQLPITWKHFFEYLRAIRRVRLNWYEQTRCYLYMVKWLGKHLVWPLQRRWRKMVAERAGHSNLLTNETQSGVN